MQSRTSILLACLILLAVAVDAGVNSRLVLLHVQTGDNPYCGSHLQEFLKRDLTRNRNLRVSVIESDQTGRRAFPDDPEHLDSLVSWGTAANGRYLLLVTVDTERLERRKRFHLPLVMHQYKTVGIIQGELRLIDLARGRWVIAEPFKVEKGGPQCFQAGVYDDDTDPAANLTAPAKVKFMRQLEEKASKKIMKRLAAHIGVANNGNGK